MKDKKNIIIIIVVALAIAFMIGAAIVLIKGDNNNSEQETTSEDITVELSIDDYYQKFEKYCEEKDYAKALNYGYMYLDESEDVQSCEAVLMKIADIYVQYKNYEAATSLLKDSSVEGLYDKYCQDVLDLNAYEGVYPDEQSEEHVFLGSYPQSGYALEVLPEYVANATFDSEGYAQIYGVKYIKQDDIIYVYEPVRWWKIGEEIDNYCFLSECILDTQCFNTAFGPATWDVSSLRTWLTGEFYNNCFSDKEKENLATYLIPASNDYYHHIAYR